MSGHLFEIEVQPMGGTAYADDAEGAYLAVTTLLREQGLGPGGSALVRELATGLVVWQGRNPYATTT